MAHQAQNSGDPNLCANNCGFYGNPATNNLCSKCYKELLMKQTKELGDHVSSSNNKIDVSQEKLVAQVVEEVGSTSSDVDNNNNNSVSDNRAANRCNLCKKRVGLTGFKCRCGHTFCSSHRYSDKHNCAFDYKGAAQDAIARANPVVKADKIDKI